MSQVLFSSFFKDFLNSYLEDKRSVFNGCTQTSVRQYAGWNISSQFSLTSDISSSQFLAKIGDSTQRNNNFICDKFEGWIKSEERWLWQLLLRLKEIQHKEWSEGHYQPFWRRSKRKKKQWAIKHWPWSQSTGEQLLQTRTLIGQEVRLSSFCKIIDISNFS